MWDKLLFHSQTLTVAPERIKKPADWYQFMMGVIIYPCWGIQFDTYAYIRIYPSLGLNELTHWGRVTDICVSKRTIIGSDNGLSPSRRQAIIWTNAGILLIGPSRTIFSENLIEIRTFSFTKMHLKMSSGKWWPCCLGLNVLVKVPGLNVLTVSTYR